MAPLVATQNELGFDPVAIQREFLKLLKDYNAGAAELRVASLSLTATDLKSAAMQTNGTIELAPAPGVGKAVVPLNVAFSYTYGGHPFYTKDDANTLDLVFGSDPGGFRFFADPRKLFNNSGALQVSSQIYYAAVLDTTPQIKARGNAENLALNLMWIGFPMGAPLAEADILPGAGTGYAVDDTGTWTSTASPFTADAIYHVTAVNGSGGVTGIEVTDGGTAYLLGDTVTGVATTGIGTGLTGTVATINGPTAPGDGSLTVKLVYSIMDL